MVEGRVVAEFLRAFDGVDDKVHDRHGFGVGLNSSAAESGKGAHVTADHRPHFKGRLHGLFERLQRDARKDGLRREIPPSDEEGFDAVGDVIE